MSPPAICGSAKAIFPQAMHDGGPLLVVGLPAQMVLLGGFLGVIRATSRRVLKTPTNPSRPVPGSTGLLRCGATIKLHGTVVCGRAKRRVAGGAPARIRVFAR